MPRAFVSHNLAVLKSHGIPASPMVKVVCTSCVLWLLHSPVSEQPVCIAHILQKMGDLAVNQLGHLNEWRSENYNPGLQQVETKKKFQGQLVSKRSSSILADWPKVKEEVAEENPGHQPAQLV